MGRPLLYSEVVARNTVLVCLMPRCCASLLRVVQFVFSIGLIGAVITMFIQIDFLRTRDIGYHSDNVIVIPNSFSLRNEKAAFKNELEQIPGIQESLICFLLLPSGLSKWDAPIELKDENEQPYYHYNISADKSLLETMDLTLLQGANFEESAYQITQRNYDESVGESKAINHNGPTPILVNEAAVKALLIEDKPHYDW